MDKHSSLRYTLHSNVLRSQKFIHGRRTTLCYEWNTKLKTIHFSTLMLSVCPSIIGSWTCLTPHVPKFLPFLSLMCCILMWLVSSRFLLPNSFFKLKKRFWESECACLWQLIKIITLSYLVAYAEHLSNITILSDDTLWIVIHQRYRFAQKKEHSI